MGTPISNEFDDSSSVLGYFNGKTIPLWVHHVNAINTDYGFSRLFDQKCKRHLKLLEMAYDQFLNMFKISNLIAEKLPFQMLQTILK